MTLRGERSRIDGIGVRDRTWGPRGGPNAASTKSYASDLDRVKQPGGARWREIERERGRGRIQYIFGHRRDGTGFLGFVRVADGGADGWAPMNAGWIRRDGQFGGLDAARSRMRSFRNPKTGWSTHMQVELVDEHGRDMVSAGFVVSTMSEAGYGVNQLMRWDIDGGIGWGERSEEHSSEVQSLMRIADAL